MRFVYFRYYEQPAAQISRSNREGNWEFRTSRALLVQRTKRGGAGRPVPPHVLLPLELYRYFLSPLFFSRASFFRFRPARYASIGRHPKDTLPAAAEATPSATFRTASPTVIAIPMKGRNTAKIRPRTGPAASATTAGALMYISVPPPGSTPSCSRSTRSPFAIFQ